MCGLAAIIDPFIGDEERNAFFQLLILSSLRGMDSTGLATIESRHYAQGPVVGPVNTVRWAKSLGNPYQLRTRAEYNRILKPRDGFGTRALIGHCRSATAGSVSATNAHPFDVGEIIGVHNGTIRTGLTIPKDETDSEALFEHIQEHGIEGLKKVNGAFALIWYDRRDHCIYAIRNNERTLFCAYGGSKILLASEKPMLEFILARNNPRGASFTIKDLTPFYLMKLDLAEMNGKGYKGKLGNFVTIEDKTKETEYKVTTTYYGSRFPGYHSFSDDDDIWEEINKKREKASKAAEAVRESPKVEGEVGNSPIKDMFPCYPIGKGVYVTRKKYQEYLHAGCAWCSSPASEGDPVVWGESSDKGGFLYNTFLCEHCANEEGSDVKIASEWAGFDVSAALVGARRDGIRSLPF